MPPRDEDARRKALEGVQALLRYIGEDISRPGLLETPERVLRAWEQDWGRGYHCDDPTALIKLFHEDAPEPGHYDQMIVVTGIAFYSHCEHHMAPFYGKAAVAYLPAYDGKGIIGLSKLARVIDHFGRRLQVQERMTEQAADFLETHLSSSCAVMIRGMHMCMCSRGVHQQNSKTTTTALRGEFREADVKAEFFSRVRA